MSFLSGLHSRSNFQTIIMSKFGLLKISPTCRLRLSGLRTGLGILFFSCIGLPSARADLVQYFTADNPASITTNNSNVVTAWADKSGNGLHATPALGSVVYPATTSFSTGKSGLQFGPTTRSSLQLLDLTNTANLLDFNGAAASHTGFSVILAMIVDQVIAGPNDVIGVTSGNTAGGFGLRFNSSGQFAVYMGGISLTRPATDVEVAAGNKVLLALNYDAATGKVTLWDSLNNSEFIRTIPKGNFAGTGKVLRLGHTDNATAFFNGSVGELRIYDGVLSPAAFTHARAAMADVWLKKPMQVLDASIPASITGNPVTQWTDQSGGGYHATPALGDVSYPATNPFLTGLAGLQFGPTARSLQLLDVTNTASLLNFNDAASTHSGFSVLVSVRVDQVGPTAPSDILGVTSVNNSGGFGLRLNSAGQVVTYMGGNFYARPAADRRAAAGQTVVIGVNYDAASGVVTLWDSLNGTDFTATVTKGNFAETNKPLRLGHTDNSSNFLNGSVGEVRIFAAKLSAAEFSIQRDAMTNRWLGEAPTLPVMPEKDAFTITELLNWSPATDPDSPFKVATVPLQSRINVPAALKANANAKSGQGGIQPLDFYAGSRPQGQAGSVYTMTYWQYVQEAVFWAGVGADIFNPPTCEMVDCAHRNGIPILGTIFFAPTVYGGDYTRVQTFLTKTGSTYPAADKLIEMANHYGFDGWFINQETAGGNATDAAAMRDLVRYIRQNSSLKISWYDAMNESGSVGWQDRLNTSNDWYMRHNYTKGLQDSAGELIADSMFVDFSSDSTTTLPTNSRTRALALALDPYKIWTGLETQGEDFKTSTSARVKMAKAFPDGLNHITSVGFYQPKEHANAIADQDLFWSGASGDPRNTSSTVGTGAWKGVAHNIAERSVIDSLPFTTDFCTGQGANYYINGVIAKTGSWWNRALQGILPTWRWIIDTTGTKLVPDLWNGDAYRGGGCLRVSGNLDADNTMRLYLTDLPVSANTRLKIVFKRNGLSGVDSLMQVGVSTTAAPTTFTFYPAGACTINGWNQTVIDLSAHAGTNIAALALKFSSPSAVSSYEMRVGQISIYEATAPAPVPPTNVQALDVVGWNWLVHGRVKWDHAPGDRYGYNVYVRLTNGSLVFVGTTVSNYFYFEKIPITADCSSIAIQTIGLDGAESALSNAAPTITAISDLSVPSGRNTGALPFTISDVETVATTLTLTRGSSNTSLVPLANISLGGSAASRTITATPVSGQTGSATITVTVSDGTLSAAETFLLTVTPSFASWSASQGVPGALATSDEDNDGISNLMEYAVGTSLQSPNASPGNLSGAVITYAKGSNAITNGDVTWIIETSETLAPGSWTTQVTHNPGNTSSTISHTLSSSLSGRVFARLRVSQSP
jgi:endo-beta-N-acetylglucosaminidase D